MHGFLQTLGEVLGPVLIGLATYLAAQLTAALKSRKDKAHKPVEDTHQQDVEITLILERALYRLDAQRVYLSQFHNGENFFSEGDIKRKSRTHERAKKGVSYQAESFRGILVSSLTDEMSLVLEHGPSFTLVDDLPPSKFRWLVEQGGAKAVARCAVRHGRDLIGFLGADFDTTVRPPDIDSLCRDAYQISNILAGYK